MGHLHNLAVGAGFVCATGCNEALLVDLTDAQREDVRGSLEDNDRTLPIYETLFKHMNAEAVFSEEGIVTPEEAYAELEAIQESGWRLFENGQIYGYEADADTTQEDKKDAWAYFHDAEMEEDKYIAFAVDSKEDEIVWINGPVILHELAHDFGEHTGEVSEMIESGTKTDQQKNDEIGYSNDFTRAVVEQRDLAYLYSSLGEIVRLFLLSAELPNERFEQTVSWRLNDLKQTPENVYELLAADDILLPQDQWATKAYNDMKEQLPHPEALGLTDKEIIDIFSTETCIYPEAHTEYAEKLAEFKREWIDAKEDTEAELPEEADEQSARETKEEVNVGEKEEIQRRAGSHL